MPPKLYAGKCRICQRTFHSYDIGRDLCGDSCHVREEYDKRFKRRLREKKHYTQDCANCKKTFSTTNSQKKFCTKSCQVSKTRETESLKRLKSARTVPRKKGLPLHVLNELLEWKRVNGYEPWLSQNGYRRWVNANKAKKEKGHEAV